jgi:hypothetical protein
MEIKEYARRTQSDFCRACRESPMDAFLKVVLAEARFAPVPGGAVPSQAE